jgi:hypothetical protein
VRVDANGDLNVSATIGPIQYTRNATPQDVIEDTTDSDNDRPLPVNEFGHDPIEFGRITASITTGAYTEVVASLSANVKTLDIFNSTGEALYLATGAAGSESDKYIIPPGGPGIIPIRFKAGTRISVKAIDSNTTTGNGEQLNINFLG